MLEPTLSAWNLVPDGPAIATPAAHLLPVRRQGEPAILKLSSEPDHLRGGALLEWWGGEGAARVLARDDHALLMERACGPVSLAAMARDGRDDEACRILCTVAARLHAPRPGPRPELVPLEIWFRDLWPAAENHGGVLARCARVAEDLLAAPREVGVLHGDLHHGNVLDFGPRGFLAIDPKGLLGERGFDFANLFTNPDLADPTRPVATEPGRLMRRLAIVSEAAGLERGRLLAWIAAWAGLSAAWFLQDDDTRAKIDLTIAGIALATLDG